MVLLFYLFSSLLNVCFFDTTLFNVDRDTLNSFPCFHHTVQASDRCSSHGITVSMTSDLKIDIFSSPFFE